MDKNASPSKNALLTLSIRDPERFIFRGYVNSITTYNNDGLFDILPYHENFITSIYKRLVVKIQDEFKEFPIEKAIMKVEANQAQVFIINNNI